MKTNTTPKYKYYAVCIMTGADDNGKKDKDSITIIDTSTIYAGSYREAVAAAQNTIDHCNGVYYDLYDSNCNYLDVSISIARRALRTMCDLVGTTDSNIKAMYNDICGTDIIANMDTDVTDMIQDIAVSLIGDVAITRDAVADDVQAMTAIYRAYRNAYRAANRAVHGHTRDTYRRLYLEDINHDIISYTQYRDNIIGGAYNNTYAQHIIYDVYSAVKPTVKRTLIMLASGRTQSEIATLRGISRQAVHKHIIAARNVLYKLYPDIKYTDIRRVIRDQSDAR